LGPNIITVLSSCKRKASNDETIDRRLLLLLFAAAALGQAPQPMTASQVAIAVNQQIDQLAPRRVSDFSGAGAVLEHDLTLMARRLLGLTPGNACVVLPPTPRRERQAARSFER
jgi:hypothetical protein